jgi:hypothetical protein
MPLSCARQPVILMGMSRSGTTLVAELLDRLGLFLGNPLQKDHEAKYFYAVNSRILAGVHASWDNPAPARIFLHCDEAVEMTVRCLEADLSSYRIVRYLGVKQYLRYFSLARYRRPWGWKDPANVFTLPVWIKVFPKAKIVYLVRNGVDVANSLLTREHRLVSRRRAREPRRFGVFSARSTLERAGFKGAARCLSLEGSFSLWEEYSAQAEETLSSILNERRVIQFENFLAQPEGYLLDLAQFCGLNAEPKFIEEAAQRIDPMRSNAYASNPTLRNFHQKVSTSRWMVHYGYAEANSSFGDVSLNRT